MAAGDWPDRVNHCQQRQTERECHAHKSDVAAGQNRATDSPEHQHKRTQKFR